MNINNHVEVLEGGKLQVTAKEIPEIDANEVLVKVHLSGLCGSDMPRIFNNGAHFYPLTLGHEFSGEVVKTGSSVSKVATGDRISCAPLVPCLECDECNKGYYSLCKNYSFVGSRRQGGNAQYVAIPQECCFKISDSVSFQEGAFFEPVTVGLHPIVMNGGCKDKNVVIIGAGTIGLLTLQVAKALGAKSVTTIDIADEKLDVAKKLGSDHIVNSLSQEQIDAFIANDELKKDQLIIEIAGVPATFKLCLKIAGPRAQIYLVGTIHNDFALSYKEYEQILRKEASVTGSWMNYSAAYPGEEWQIAADLFSKGKINTDILLDGVYSADDYISRVSDLPNTPLKGKILLNWANSN